VRAKWDAGLYVESLKLHVPRNFELVSKPPQTVAFQLVPATQPIKPVGIAP
jgi:hypothetical protein